MDSKYFVPFETAKELKEKGYPQALATKYYKTFNGETTLLTDRESASCVVEGNTSTPYYARLHNFYVAAPTYHEVVDWLEDKGFIVTVECSYEYSISSELIHAFRSIVYTPEGKVHVSEWTTTREFALNDGITKVLENYL